MFKGTVPGEVRAMLYEAAQDWQADALAVACSGNFTIERVFAGRMPLMGCDVTIYSCALGAWFARKPFEATLRPEHAEAFGWIADGMKDQAGTTATIMLLTGLSDALDKNLAVKQNAYYTRLVDGYRRKWPEMLEKTRERLETSPLQLRDYFAGDAVDWLPTLGPEIAVATFPPFFGGDYEAMFGKLDGLFDWPKPSYQEIFEARRKIFLAALVNRPHWAIGTRERLDGFDDHLRGTAKTTNRGVPLYLYASAGKTRVVAPRQATEPVSVPRLAPGDEIGGRLWIAPLSYAKFAALRSQYMNENIKPGMPTQAYAVLVDDRLIGCYALQKAYKVPGATADAVYLLSDFPVAPTDYTRLAKLVLYAAQSTEARLLAERVCKMRVRLLVTTAFTDNPVSMKYRGLFDLHSRKEAGSKSDHKFQLQYMSGAGRWTLAEGLAEWKRKHGSRLAPSEPTREG